MKKGKQTAADLVTRAKQGDLDALVQIVHDNYEQIYKRAFSILRDPDNARDVTQDMSFG
jgi:DNA-directed RNA polymerase specialized sigma24 family protein